MPGLQVVSSPIQPTLSPKVLSAPAQPALAPKVVTQPVQPKLAPKVVTQPQQPQFSSQVQSQPQGQQETLPVSYGHVIDSREATAERTTRLNCWATRLLQLSRQ